MPELQLTNPVANAENRPADLLESAISLVEGEMAEVNSVISSRLDSDIALINTLGSYIIHSGGKRLRPVILLLCARSCDYHGSHHTLLAAVIEFIHTATLLHDDVVDASATRRGKATANDVWGNEASVLVGDFLYSRSFEMMVETRNMRVMEILAETTNAIAEGEVLQLLNAHSPDTTEQQYFETIHRKTARLFAAAAELGGVIAGADDDVCETLARYGTHLGTAFQLVDDILDYEGNSEDIGKDVGDDLAEGKPTLPLIHALQHGSSAQQQTIRSAIEQGDRDQIAPILEIVRDTGALDYTRTQARLESEKARDALSELPPSEFARGLASLAEFSLVRAF